MIVEVGEMRGPARHLLRVPPKRPLRQRVEERVVGRDRLLQPSGRFPCFFRRRSYRACFVNGGSGISKRFSSVALLFDMLLDAFAFSGSLGGIHEIPSREPKARVDQLLNGCRVRSTAP